jgi:SAM-dependent methyltransferase
MSIHPAAANGFERAPEAYERGRPDYPSAAIDYLCDAFAVTPSCTVVDLGAGTGKFTQRIANRARVIAVEPVEAMRAELSARHLPVEILTGTAEAIPLAARSASAVVCAQAFHWFNGAAALSEIHRVLAPGGKLGLIWNVRDESVAWVARLTGLIDRYEGDVPRYRTGAWRSAFNATALFTPLASVAFDHVHRGARDMVLDRVLSISFIAALSSEEKNEIRTDVLNLLDTDPELKGRAEIAFPYRCEVFWCERREV